MIERSWVEVPTGVMGEFSSPGSSFCADSFFSICSTPVACKRSQSFGYSGLAQLVECPTEKSGAVLTRVRVPGAASDFSPRVSFQCRLPYGVHTAPPPTPPCAFTCIDTCAHVKTLAAIPLDTLRTLMGMCNAALAATVP